MNDTLQTLVRIAAIRVSRSGLSRSQKHDLADSLGTDIYLWMHNRYQTTPFAGDFHLFVTENGGLASQVAWLAINSVRNRGKYVVALHHTTNEPKVYTQYAHGKVRDYKFRDPDPLWIEQEHREHQIACLPVAYRAVVRERLSGKTARQIAKARGVSHQWIYNVLNDAKARLSNDTK